MRFKVLLGFSLGSCKVASTGRGYAKKYNTFKEIEMSRLHHETRALRQIAVWIDHREAILAVFANAHLLREGEIFSEAGPHTHGGGWSQRRIEAHRHAILDHYYEEVVQNLTGADEVILYGPGQAKHELWKHINRINPLNQRVIDLVTTDRLSEYEFIRMAVDGFASVHANSMK
jgi:stalled ribosome rescue protein Dom34